MATRARLYRCTFVSVATLTLLAACQWGPEPAVAEAPSDVKVLQTFPAGGAFFQLTLGPCEKTECRLAVRLLEANRVQDARQAPPIPPLKAADVTKIRADLKADFASADQHWAKRKPSSDATGSS